MARPSMQHLLTLRGGLWGIWSRVDSTVVVEVSKAASSVPPFINGRVVIVVTISMQPSLGRVNNCCSCCCVIFRERRKKRAPFINWRHPNRDNYAVLICYTTDSSHRTFHLCALEKSFKRGAFWLKITPT